MTLELKSMTRVYLSIGIATYRYAQKLASAQALLGPYLQQFLLKRKLTAKGKGELW